MTDIYEDDAHETDNFDQAAEPAGIAIAHMAALVALFFLLLVSVVSAAAVGYQSVDY